MPDKFDDKEIDEVYNSLFGIQLFNDYTLLRERNEILYFTSRMTIVRRMIHTMLDTEQELRKENIDVL